MATLKLIRRPPERQPGNNYKRALHAVVVAETGEFLTGVQSVEIKIGARGEEKLILETVDFSVVEDVNLMPKSSNG